MEIEQGYEDERFQTIVPDNFHCVICLNVLKEPMQCVRNEHSFCKPCIIRHLQERESCPTCIEPLTSQTLRPSRVITNLISQLSMKCDNVKRGCPDIMKLEMLEAHIANCEFSPVKCSNDGCEMIVNRKDQLHHENNECDYRKEKCVVCGKDVPHAKRLIHCYMTKTEMNEVRREIHDMKEMIMNLSRDLTDLTRRMGDKNDQKQEVKGQMGEMTDLKTQMGNVKRKVIKIKKEIQSLKQEPQSFIRSLDSPITCSEQNVNIRDDVIIAGGRGLKSVELFSWETRQWERLPPMTSVRWCSLSFVHVGQMFVCGGLGSEDSMEILELGPHVLQWMNYPAEFSKATWGHTSAVYKDNLFIFGGYSRNTSISAIHKVSLVSPYSSQVVCNMPGPRVDHGAQRFSDKVVIVGGTRTPNASDSVDTVFVYDITNNRCQTLAPLPFAVCRMATVAWKDNIIIIGGVDKNNNELNTVVSYNTKEETSKMLPSMKQKRSDCTAVVTENVIVVMGGRNKEEGDLNCVECFNFCNYVWEELPPMKEKRAGSMAVVKCET